MWWDSTLRRMMGANSSGRTASSTMPSSGMGDTQCNDEFTVWRVSQLTIVVNSNNISMSLIQ